jgi:predicted kinase
MIAASTGHDGRVVTIVVAGPQATGKTTLALALGDALAIPVFSRDPLMAALAAGHPRFVRRCLGGRTARAGLRLQTALLARQLQLGQSAILECVAPVSARADWRRLTAAAGGRYVAVECACSDQAMHRNRLAARQDQRGRSVSWRQVQATLRNYQPDPEADFLADAVLPVPELAAGVIALIGRQP